MSLLQLIIQGPKIRSFPWLMNARPMYTYTESNYSTSRLSTEGLKKEKENIRSKKIILYIIDTYKNSKLWLRNNN